MANPEQVATLMEGPEAWNAWRRSNQGVWPDLSGATLTGLDLSRYHLDDANLSRADLQGVTLDGTKLYRVFAEQSNWTGAHIQNSAFVILKADQSTFDETKMFGAIFHLCSLRESSFREANLRYTIFAAVDLYGARGLTQAYLDRATIGIDTFFKSGGLPDEFLHAANIPDEFITYARSLTGRAIEFYSCFISYSSKDAAFTTRLHADLQKSKHGTPRRI